MSNYKQNFQRYRQEDVEKFMQIKARMPHLFLTSEDELNGEFWGDEDDDYDDSPISRKPYDKPYTDDLKSDNW
jgi:hypothetical protein